MSRGRPAVRKVALALGSAGWVFAQSAFPAEIFIRASQVGYHMNEGGGAVAFAKAPLPAEFRIVQESRLGNVFFEGRTRIITNAIWGQFTNHVELDFSSLYTPGRYVIKLGEASSLPIKIGNDPFGELAAQSLEFMRQQRCGFNPWLNTNCHQRDGRTAFGRVTNGTPIDARGGWHDAGDLLKYLLTSGNATAQLLLAYELGPKPYYSEKTRGMVAQPWAEDRVSDLGLPRTNGIPDILDEARWGLEWMLKLHPAPDQLYHQVADDRDHYGWRLPQDEQADYGWGSGGTRVVYCADGKPQGLQQFKSESTGVANVAGRYAAAMALAYQIWKPEPASNPNWKGDPGQKGFAAQCLKAGREVYELGRRQEGVQQGNSFKAPYRYEETTWADDMEWGAAELFRATGEQRYLEEAKRYAKLAGDESWMGREQSKHYQFYPFLNAGHFRLYELVDEEFKKVLAGWYRDGIERCARAGERNPYRVGVPFIWCSDNLVVALTTQCLLYERMTGDTRYRAFAAKQRDWLLGRNPWGVTMFTEIGVKFPTRPHLMTTELTKRTVRGGLVDGPVYERIFKSLKGVTITEPDPLAAFQGEAVYHDDLHDYSTNEPTMDGTASAVLMFAQCSQQYP